MFGFTKYQILEIVILLVIFFHLRKVYEATVAGSSQFLTKTAA